MKLLLCALFACSASSTGSKPKAPVAPVAPVVAPEPDAELDIGTFEIGESRSKAIFSIKRAKGQLIYFQASEARSPDRPPEKIAMLTTDLQSHPIEGTSVERGYNNEAGETLKGTPLALSRWHMAPSKAGLRKAYSTPATATGPIDVFVDWPIPLAWTPLCRVSSDVVWTTLGHGDYVEAYRAGAIDKYSRIVMRWGYDDYELVCEGDKLIAGMGGTERFVRDDRREVLDLLEKQPRPEPHAWKHPMYRPWSPSDEVLVGTILVTIDTQPRIVRLTAFDTVARKVVATRDLEVPLNGGLECRPTSRGLLCAHDRVPFVRVFTPTTLENRDDFTAKVQRITKEWRSIASQVGDRITFEFADEGVELDVAKGTARPVHHPKEVTWTEPKLCEEVEDEELSCRPKIGFYMINQREIRLKWLDEKADVRWTYQLDRSDKVRLVDNTFIVTSIDQTKRVTLVDATTGAVLWVGAGPLPKK